MGVSRIYSVLAALGIAILGNACEEPTSPPVPGAIMVEVNEEGSDGSELGYLSAVDGGMPRAVVQPTLRTTFTNVEPGVHTVRLEGLSPNCSIVSQNPATLEVVSNQTAIARFNVSCVANVGTIQVTTVTTGADQDASGYLALVDGVQRVPIGVNAMAAIANVRAGLRAVSLGDVAPNCTVASQPIIASLPFQGTVEVQFNVQCVFAGALEVTVTTAGIDLDPDGYVLGVEATQVGFAGGAAVPPNGSATLASLPAAEDYRVTLLGVAGNCNVAGTDVLIATVTAGSTTRIAFDVSCLPVPRLAFVRDGDIYVIKSDGTDVTRLTTSPARDDHPAWSSSGKIAFMTERHASDRELYVMNADGTNPVRIMTSAGRDDTPSWSPVGDRIVFESSRDLNSEIYIVEADGTGLTRLTNNTAGDYQPAWSSTGRIAFVSDRDHSAGEIYVMDEDGSNVVRITNNAGAESSPAWSPDGSMVAFARAVNCYYYYYDYFCGWDLFVVNADGSNERQLVNAQGTKLYNVDPSWSPDGRTIAFTQAYCPYNCDPPSIQIVDLQGNAPTLLTHEAANPAWKP